MSVLKLSYTAIVITLIAYLWLNFVSFVHANAWEYKSWDLISLHYDHAADRDDWHAAAAARSMAWNLNFNYMVVSWAYWEKNKNWYQSESEPAMTGIFWNNYLNAHKNWNWSVDTASARWAGIIKNGKKVHVAEWWQADFTADVMRKMKSSHWLNDQQIKNWLIVVQHSDWNETHANQWDLNYVRSNATYRKIADGNRWWNGTANLNQLSPSFVATAKNSPYKDAWNAAFAYLNPNGCPGRKESCKLDFSDTVELLYILWVPTSKVWDVNSFANTYLKSWGGGTPSQATTSTSSSSTSSSTSNTSGGGTAVWWGWLIVIEAESTSSSLWEWKKETSRTGFSGNGYIHFTGNNEVNGPPNSPLRYSFKADKTGQYTLMMRIQQSNTASRWDLWNDAYVRLEWDFTPGSGAPSLNDLKTDTKFYANGSNWGWNGWAPLDRHEKKWQANYNLKAGQTYTLTISGRSKGFKIDRIVFAHSSVNDATAKWATQSNVTSSSSGWNTSPTNSSWGNNTRDTQRTITDDTGIQRKVSVKAPYGVNSKWWPYCGRSNRTPNTWDDLRNYGDKKTEGWCIVPPNQVASSSSWNGNTSSWWNSEPAQQAQSGKINKIGWAGTYKTIKWAFDSHRSGQLNTAMTSIDVKDGKVYVAHVRSNHSGSSPRGKKLLPTEVLQWTMDGSWNWNWKSSIISNRTADDKWHNAPAIAVDRKGYIHVVYNMHNIPWQYKVSKRPHDISEWDFRWQDVSDWEFFRYYDENKTSFPSQGKAAIPGNQITYPAFYKDQSGKLYLAYRFAASPDKSFAQRKYSSGLATYDENSKKWTAIGWQDGWAVSMSGESGTTSYLQQVGFDRNNTMHFMDVRKDGIAWATTGRPCHIISSDQRNFKTIKGQSVNLPLRKNNCWNVDGINNSWWINSTTSFAVQSDGTPWYKANTSNGSKLMTYRDGSWRNESTPGGWQELFADKDNNVYIIGSGWDIYKRSWGGWWNKFASGQWGWYWNEVAVNENGTVAYIHSFSDSSGKSWIYAVQLK